MVSALIERGEPAALRKDAGALGGLSNGMVRTLRAVCYGDSGLPVPARSLLVPGYDQRILRLTLVTASLVLSDKALRPSQYRTLVIPSYSGLSQGEYSIVG